MKVWFGHGSEHSANLVMIGHFADVRAAELAIEKLERIEQAARAEVDSERLIVGNPDYRFSKQIMSVFSELSSYIIGPAELEQFVYDVRVEQKGDSVVITTDEYDVSGYIKMLFNSGARIELYSAHVHPNTGYGRNTAASDT